MYRYHRSTVNSTPLPSLHPIPPVACFRAMPCCLYPTHSATKRAPSVADFPLYLCSTLHVHPCCLPLDLPALSLILLFFNSSSWSHSQLLFRLLFPAVINRDTSWADYFRQSGVLVIMPVPWPSRPEDKYHVIGPPRSGWAAQIVPMSSQASEPPRYKPHDICNDFVRTTKIAGSLPLSPKPTPEP